MYFLLEALRSSRTLTLGTSLTRVPTLIHKGVSSFRRHNRWLVPLGTTMPRNPELRDTAPNIAHASDSTPQVLRIHEHSNRRALPFSGPPPWFTNGGSSGGFQWPSSGWPETTRTITDMITASSTETVNSRETTSPISASNTSIIPTTSITQTPKTTATLSSQPVNSSFAPSRTPDSASRATGRAPIPTSAVIALSTVLGLSSIAVLAFFWWRQRRSQLDFLWRSHPLNEGPSKHDLEAGAEERTPEFHTHLLPLPPSLPAPLSILYSSDHRSSAASVSSNSTRAHDGSATSLRLTEARSFQPPVKQESVPPGISSISPASPRVESPPIALPSHVPCIVGEGVSHTEGAGSGTRERVLVIPWSVGQRLMDIVAERQSGVGGRRTSDEGLDSEPPPEYWASDAH
ncbi:hypothetical protein C8Q78DRAFT_411322 [Trametes maxima]|nr:hypothetical protein C8Q78DRAFT_411322 [Trametes maxima]